MNSYVRKHCKHNKSKFEDHFEDINEKPTLLQKNRHDRARAKQPKASERNHERKG